MTDFSLEVSIHSEGLANGELRSQFSVILLAPGGNAQFEPRSTPLSIRLMQRSQCTVQLTAKFLSDISYPKINHFTLYGPQRFTLSPLCLYLLPYEHYLGSFRDLLFPYTLSHQQPPHQPLPAKVFVV